MNQPDHPEQGPPEGGGGKGEQPRSQHLSARVPESVSRGIFSSGVIVMTGGTEFILDFVQNLGQPAQVAARVVMPHVTLPQFIDALQRNVEMYRQRFGPPPELPKPPETGRPATVQDIYDDVKIRDELLSGAYCNAVMIAHSPSDFKFDFLTNTAPHPAVSCRIYMSAAQVLRTLDSLIKTHQQFQQRVAQQRQQQQHPPDDPPEEGGSDPPPGPETPPPPQPA